MKASVLERPFPKKSWSKIRGSCRNKSLIDLKLNVFHLTFPCNASSWNHEQAAPDFLKTFQTCVGTLKASTDLCSSSGLCSPSATWTWKKNYKNVFLLFLLKICKMCVSFLARLITKNHPLSCQKALYSNHSPSLVMLI